MRQNDLIWSSNISGFSIVRHIERLITYASFCNLEDINVCSSQFQKKKSIVSTCKWKRFWVFFFSWIVSDFLVEDDPCVFFFLSWRWIWEVYNSCSTSLLLHLVIQPIRHFGCKFHVWNNVRDFYMQLDSWWPCVKRDWNRSRCALNDARRCMDLSMKRS